MQGSTSQFLRCPSSIRGKRRHRKRKCGTVRTFGSAGSIVCGGKTRFNLVSGFFYEPSGSSIRASSSSGPADDTAARHARQQSHSFFSICLLHSGIGLHSGCGNRSSTVYHLECKISTKFEEHNFYERFTTRRKILSTRQTPLAIERVKYNCNRSKMRVRSSCSYLYVATVSRDLYARFAPT